MANTGKKSYLMVFILVLGLEMACMFYLILGHRMVIGHDGFELFSHQWFFINSAISHHEIPLWSPYLNHGIPVWWYFIYSRVDMFSNVLMLFAQWIKGANFLGFFYGSLFFDKFILLCGVWLLAKRYFNSPVTVFFVATTVMATTVTYTQNSFSLVMFYSIPLIIYLLHRFFDTSHWKWLFLAAFFFCTISINALYFISIITLAVFIYFLTVACVSRGEIIKGFKVAPKDIIWIVATLVMVSILGVIYVLGHDPLIYFSTTLRQPNGGVPLEVFLNYGGSNNLLKWWELSMGTCLRLDYTLYMGLLSIPLIFVGVIFSKNTHKYPFLWGALFFLLFSCATPISVLAYYFWPLMKLYRHIGYVAPLIKLYLCFLAGFGFERLFDSDQDQEVKGIFKMSMMASSILLFNALFLCQLVISPSLAHFMIDCLGPDIRNRVSAASLSEYFFSMALFSMLVSLVFFFRPFIKFPKYSSSYLIILLFLHLGIVYWYAYDEIQLRTFPLTQQEYAMMDFRKIPYLMRREDGQGVSTNPREVILGDLQGSIRNAVNNFTFSDVVKPKQNSDFCLRPAAQLLSVFQSQKQSSVLNKLAGVSQDKIQFFSKANSLGSVDAIISKLLDQNYAGDILFYLTPGQEPSMGNDDLKGLALSGNQRLTIAYKVLSFSPNQIIISTDTTREGVWMQYSDTWHPTWKAEINGKPQNLYISSLAYKALPLQLGKNIIRLYVESKPVEWLYGFFMASSLVWMFLLIWLLV